MKRLCSKGYGRPGAWSPARAAITLASVLLCASCTWYFVNADFTKALDYQPRSHTKDEILLLMMGTVPTQPNYHVGLVKVSRGPMNSNDEMFDAMRDLGVKHGFDGISEIYCDVDYYSAFLCTGQAFVFK